MSFVKSLRLTTKCCNAGRHTGEAMTTNSLYVFATVGMAATVFNGCPSTTAALGSIGYPKEVHEADWVPPDVACQQQDHPRCNVEVHVGECRQFTPQVVWETVNFAAQLRRPKPVEKLEAACLDAAECSAHIRDHVVFVRGNKAGTSRVRVSYDHPVTHEHHEHVVSLEFTEKPPADPVRGEFERRRHQCPE